VNGAFPLLKPKLVFGQRGNNGLHKDLHVTLRALEHNVVDVEPYSDHGPNVHDTPVTADINHDYADYDAEYGVPIQAALQQTAEDVHHMPACPVGIL
jgi:hypothetical protein